MTFRELLRSIILEKKTILCVSIDPVLEKIRQRAATVYGQEDYSFSISKNVLVDFILDTVDKVRDYAAAVKINLWYVLPLDLRDLVYISNYILSRGLVPILDCKINDITDTVSIGLRWIYLSGFKCVTVNPLPGNLDKICKICKEYNIGTLVLTLMSNPEAVKYFKTRVDNKHLYEIIAEDVRLSDADGCVVGTTGHVTEEDIRNIRRIVGQERVLFLVGVGFQGGSIDKLRAALPGLVLVNVGRDIVYSENPQERAREYRDRLWSIMSEYVQVL